MMKQPQDQPSIQMGEVEISNAHISHAKTDQKNRQDKNQGTSETSSQSSDKPSVIKDFFTNIKNKFQSLSKTQIRIIIASVILLVLIAIGSTIAAILLYEQKFQQNHTVLVAYQGAQMHITPHHIYGQNGTNGVRNHTHTVHHTHNKSQSVEHEILSTIHLVSYDKDKKEKIYEFTAPLFQIFQILTNMKRSNEKFVEWLSQFNKDSKAFIDQFMHILKQRISKHKHSEHANSTHPAFTLQLLSYTSKILIDVQYQPATGNFSIVSYKESESSQYKIQDKAEKETNETRAARVSRFLGVAATELHRIARGLHHSFRRLEDEAWKNHRLFVQSLPAVMSANWQHTLLRKCRTIKSLKFRCELETVKHLVPDVDQEKLEEKYEVVHALLFRIKETELKTQ